jgi:hypothetical protein
MAHARWKGLLILLAVRLGCQRGVKPERTGKAEPEAAPPAFAGSKAGQERKVAGMALCWCPPGRFTMGSPPDEPERRSGEDQVEVRNRIRCQLSLPAARTIRKVSCHPRRSAEEGQRSSGQAGWTRRWWCPD